MHPGGACTSWPRDQPGAGAAVLADRPDMLDRQEREDSDLAQEVLKDSYNFGFLTLGERIEERAVHRGWWPICGISSWNWAKVSPTWVASTAWSWRGGSTGWTCFSTICTCAAM